MEVECLPEEGMIELLDVHWFDFVVHSIGTYYPLHFESMLLVIILDICISLIKSILNPWTRTTTSMAFLPWISLTSSMMSLDRYKSLALCSVLADRYIEDRASRFIWPPWTEDELATTLLGCGWRFCWRGWGLYSWVVIDTIKYK